MYLEFLLCMVILIYFTRNREGFNRPSQRSTERLPENKPFRTSMEIKRQQQPVQKKREQLGILISKQKITL